MAFDHPANILGLHENQFAFRGAEAGFNAGELKGSGSPAETAFMKRERENWEQQSGYQHLQSTRPQTLVAALADTPIGQATWIIEKFYYWSDRTHIPFERLYTMEHLVGEAMYYLVTDSFATSIAPYAALASVEEEKGVLPAGQKITVPVAFAVFPNDGLQPIPPRSLMERSRANILQWSEMPRGGHFPMLEDPRLLVEDLRNFARRLPRH
jgi:pimeloyl-ACP methyl ester carboxylesterase